MRDIESFHECLRQEGEYHTPTDLHKAFPYNALGRSDALFYSRVFLTFMRAWAQARTGRYTWERFAASSLSILRTVEKCGGDVHIEGADAMAALQGPVVYVSNHMSMLETTLLPCILLCGGEISLVIKESLLGYPVFGPVVKSTLPIAVTRRDPRADLKEVLRKGCAFLEQGRSVVVFPQATRTAYLDVARFNSIGVKLAERAGVHVVPLALQTDFLGVGQVFRDFGALDRSRPVRFALHEPVATVGRGREAHQDVLAAIAGSLRAWGVEVRDRQQKGETP